jgi:DNA-binding transcriptional MocR family regulator
MFPWSIYQRFQAVGVPSATPPPHSRINLTRSAHPSMPSSTTDKHNRTPCTPQFHAIPTVPKTMTSSQNEPPINLLRGWPSSTLLPTTLIKNAATAALSNPLIANDALSYGPDPGYEPARVAIAHWLSQSYKPASPITPDRLCITGGASQNLGSLLSVYTDPAYTRNIWIVAPAYFLAFGIFEDAGFAGKMRAVPEDGEGLDIAFLEREIGRSEDVREEHASNEPLTHGDTTQKGTNHSSTQNVSPSHHPMYKPSRTHAKVYKHIIYCVPSFANPSSRTMSMRRRKELVKLARRYDALLVADDVYDFLQWPAEHDSEETVDSSPLVDASSLRSQQEYFPRLIDIDRELDGGAEREGADGFGNACSNGSFSKIAGPGVRCGWLEGTKKLAYGVSQT